MTPLQQLQLQALFAGIMFGIYPPLINRSGLDGKLSIIAMALIAAILVCPLARFTQESFVNIQWKYVIIASVLSTFGVVAFNGMLASTTKDMVSSLVVIMLIAQVSAAAVAGIITSGGFTPKKALGFACAAAAALLLRK